jgi:hypothetical protein
MKSRVFVVQEQREKNFLPAEKFGEIHVLLTTRDVDRGTEHCINVLTRKLMDIKPTDYMILVGDAVIIALAFHVAINFSEDDGLIILRWDRNHYRYNPEHIKI